MYNYIYDDGITKNTAYQYHKDRICNNIYANNYISTLIKYLCREFAKKIDLLKWKFNEHQQ